MKILVLGTSRSGKDDFAKLLTENTKLRYSNVSIKASETFIFPALKGKYNYSDPIDCFLDRDNHREEWFKLFQEYNKEDKSRFVKEILKDSDFYIGLRDYNEVEESRYLFDLAVWIDAEERLDFKESSKSFTATKEQADYVLDNNGDYDSFLENIDKFIEEWVR